LDPVTEKKIVNKSKKGKVTTPIYKVS